MTSCLPEGDLRPRRLPEHLSPLTGPEAGVHKTVPIGARQEG